MNPEIEELFQNNCLLLMIERRLLTDTFIGVWDELLQTEIEFDFIPKAQISTTALNFSFALEVLIKILLITKELSELYSMSKCEIVISGNGINSLKDVMKMDVRNLVSICTNLDQYCS